MYDDYVKGIKGGNDDDKMMIRWYITAIIVFTKFITSKSLLSSQTTTIFLRLHFQIDLFAGLFSIQYINFCIS